MAARRRYSEEQRTTATGIAAVEGVTEAERQTGIPKETIHYWLSQPQYAHLRTKTQDERADQFKVVAQLALGRLVELIPTMKPHDLIILAGVAAEKGQLLGGQATARTESVSITDGLDDHEKRTLAGVIREELARRAGREPAGDPAGVAVGSGTEGQADTTTG